MKFAILGSGRGTNAEAILTAWQEGRLGKAEPVLLLCDQPGARILDVGKRFGIPTELIAAGPFRAILGKEVEAQYVARMEAAGAELSVHAGFMRIVKKTYLRAYAGRAINLHPSLLPSFPGLDAIGQAWRAGVTVTGCTVHVVTAEVDAGPILDQCAVRVADGDTLATLEAKVHEAEHALLPDVVLRLARGSLSLNPPARS